MAAQLMATNCRCDRPESLWTARASSSLPVPLSPSSNTVALVGATFSIARHTLRMESLTPMMPSSAIEPVAQAAIVLQNEKLTSLHLCSRQQLRCHTCSRLPSLVQTPQDFTLKCKGSRHFLCAAAHNRGGASLNPGR